MNSTTMNTGSVVAATVCAYFAIGMRPAHAQACDFTPHSIDPNTAFVVSDNPFGTQPNNCAAAFQQCINWSQSSGGFSVLTNTDTNPTCLIGYPHIMKGQSYGEGPTNPQNLLPVKVSDIKTWPVAWTIDGVAASGSWDAPIEFWATTYNPNGAGCSPPACSSGRVTQADGTELMVWLNARNQIPGDFTPIGQVIIGGVLWDVRVTGLWGPNKSYSSSCAPNCPAIYWNLIAYFPANGVRLTSISTDFKPFFDDAQNRGDPSPQPKPGRAPCQKAGTMGANGGNGSCIDPGWYVTSVQAGFELFGDPGGQSGVGLSSSGFSVSLNRYDLATVDVLWEGTDASLLHRRKIQGTWEARVSLSPGPLGSPPHPVSPGSGVEDIFWMGAESAHNLWHKYYIPGTGPNAGWHGPENLFSGATIGPVGEPQPISPAPGVVDVFWPLRVRFGNPPSIPPTVDLMHTYYVPGTGWRTPPEDLGGGNLGSAPRPVAFGGGSEDVFWVGEGGTNLFDGGFSEGDLWHKQYVSGVGWNPNAEDLFANDPRTLSGPMGEPQPVSPSPGVIDVLWKESDNTLWHKFCVGGCGPGTWQPKESLVGCTGPSAVCLASAPHPVSPSNGVEDVFYRGTDNNLWHEWYVPGFNWNGPENLTKFSPGNSGLLSSDPQPVSPQAGVWMCIGKVRTATYGINCTRPMSAGVGRPSLSAPGLSDPFRGQWHPKSFPSDLPAPLSVVRSSSRRICREACVRCCGPP